MVCLCTVVVVVVTQRSGEIPLQDRVTCMSFGLWRVRFPPVLVRTARRLSYEKVVGG